MYITETPAEREAYDALEALARKWQAAQEPAPFQLTRVVSLKSKVHPRAVKRASQQPQRPSIWARVSAGIASLFNQAQVA